MHRKKWVLPVIVLSQFCCTSLWFAGNGVVNDLAQAFGFEGSAVGHLTSAVQFGFISGTLVFALLTISDRFSPSIVFVASALLGALFNLGTISEQNTLFSLLVFRFLTGFFLAGVYPVGMKIAADHYEKGLGKSLGFLVGALVVGTAFPHLLKGLVGNGGITWRIVLVLTSAIAVLGGALMVLFVPNGPFRKQSQKPDLSAFFKVFQNRAFRRPAFGYFGHMWELYAFWAFVPAILTTYVSLHPEQQLDVPVLSFFIIASGGLGCVLGGQLSQRFGTRQTAFFALFCSAICCLLSPFLFLVNSGAAFLAFLVFWGMTVVADSPLFSTMVAQNAEPDKKGTALTIVNCIGFAITIVSIQLLGLMKGMEADRFIYVVLAIGPILGLLVLHEKGSSPASQPKPPKPV